ncbi:MAG: hypothetical protein ACP5JG_14200, partial [Anaerolineae bacterium]
AESVAIWEDLGIASMVAYRRIPLGFAKVHLGQYEEAGALARAGLDAAQQAGDAGKMGFAWLVLGWVALARRAYAEALRCLQKSADFSQAVVAQDQMGETLALMGYGARGLGQPLHARRYLGEALRIAADLDVCVPLVLALPAIALLQADEGEVEQAVELYELARRYPFVANSRWFEDVVERHITAVTASLPPDVSATAQGRARERDLQATAAALLTELRALSSAPRPRDAP